MSYHRIDVRHARLLFPVHYGKKRKFRRRTERGRKQLSSVVNQNSVANTGSGTDKQNKGFGFPTQKMWVCVSTSRQPPRYNSLWVFSMTGKLRWQAWKLWFRGFFWGLLTTLRLHVYIREESLSKNWMSPHLTNRNVKSSTHQISCSPYIGSPKVEPETTSNWANSEAISRIYAPLDFGCPSRRSQCLTRCGTNMISLRCCMLPEEI